MSCSNCGAEKPDPFECGDEYEEIKAYWFLVKDGPADIVGIESDGDFAHRFSVCETLEHPEPEPGEQVLCAGCFDLIFPPNPGVEL